MAIKALTHSKSADVGDETGHEQSVMDLGVGGGQNDGVSIHDFNMQ